MKDIIKNLKNRHTWKIQLTLTINVKSSKDTNEEHLMSSKSDIIEIVINDKVDEVINEPLESLLSIYQIALETKIKGSNFIFNCVHILH